MGDVFKTAGAVSWTELMTTDVEAAKRFYSALFGWKLEAMPMGEGGEYHVISVGDMQIGGIMARPPQGGDMPPAWGSYVTVEDVDATAAKVKDLGGNILTEPQDIPKVGRFCVLQDPQGAVIMAITYVEDHE